MTLSSRLASRERLKSPLASPTVVGFRAGLPLDLVYLTHVDRSNPVSVGNAFTKALKTGDTSSASGYFVPDKAQAWRTAADDNIRKMRSGTLERFYENIPSKPGFTSANGAS